MAFRYELLKECKETGARAGLLHTAHGTFKNADVYASRNSGNSEDFNPPDVKRC